MLEITFSDTKEFVNVIEALTLLDEANFFVSEQGLELRAMDPARVAMIDLQIPTNYFFVFDYDQGPFRLGVIINEFKQLLKRGNASDELSFNLIDDYKLQLIFKGQLSREFHCSLIDLGESQYPTPKIIDHASVTITTEIFDKIIKDAELIGDHLILEASEKNNCFIITSSSESKDFKTTIHKDDDFVANFKIKEASRSCYNLCYLKEFVQQKLGPLVKLSFSTAGVIVVEYQLTSAGKLTYFLSPRTEG